MLNIENAAISTIEHKDFLINLYLSEAKDGISLTTQCRNDEDVFYLDISLRSDTSTIFPETVIEIKQPFVDIHSCWTPGVVGNPVSIRNKGICEWRYGFESKISKLAPAGCFYNLTGQNRLSVAFSDAANTIKFHMGAYEEERAARVLLKLFTEPTEQQTNYRATLRLDSRPINYYSAIAAMSCWYERQGLQPMPVPEAALQPVYSSWYAFHQKLSQQAIEEQCKLAVEVGCKTIILDDGWQTEDQNRGYHFCGDWQVASSRFPDFKAHVAHVQSLGMHYMLWLSVPFIGGQSQMWECFSNKVLYHCSVNNAGVVDPRYPSVRKYIIDTCRRLVVDYGLDGLKLDFVDEFDMHKAEGSALEPNSERDTEALQTAVEWLLRDIRQELEAVCPDVLIEYRQRYVGPVIRQYGNILRVHDCPNDPIMNRMSIVDLRLFSNETAVHSDMLIWPPQDSVENASLYFINALFAVPQISPNLTELPAAHLSMVSHWLGFWQQYRDLLLQGELRAFYPEMQYPIISSQLAEQKIVVIYAPLTIEIFNQGECELILVNGSMESSLVVNTLSACQIDLVAYDSLGIKVESREVALNSGVSLMDFPVSGYLMLKLL